MNEKIQDFGQKIGGARKDLRGTFRLEDLRDMTHLERIRLVTKSMVWPTPDYAALVRGGYTREAAAMIKMLRDNLPPCPIVTPGCSEQRFERACACYVATVTYARELSMKGRTTGELADVFRADPRSRQYGVIVVQETNFTRYEASPGLNQWRDSMDLDYRAYSNIYHTFTQFVSGSLDHKTRRMLQKNRAWPEATSQAESWLRRRAFVPAQATDGSWCLSVSGLIPPADLKQMMQKTLGPVVHQVFQTAEDAQVALVKMATDHLKARRQKAAEKRKPSEPANPAPPPIVAPGVYRQGTEYRQNAPATGVLYLNDLKLRGGEFGVWVNQSERQVVLDRGYDAFRDLAQAYGWPKETISLGGSLAIAFGAPGKGGARSAAAHYELERGVINLTKPHGAGCLAHEWAHALDHYLGRRAHQLGLVAEIITKDAAYGQMLSNCVLHPLPRLADSAEANYLREVRTCMESIWRSTRQLGVEASKQLLLGRHQQMLEAHLTNLDRIQRHITNYILRQNGVPESQHADYLRRTGAILDTLKNPRFSFSSSDDIERTMSGLRGVVGRKGSLAWAESNINYYRRQLFGLEKAIEDLSRTGSIPPVITEDTKVRKACLELDGTGAAYYSLNHEMFARAFEVLTADQLATGWKRSPYLVEAAAGKAYPEGAERAQLRGAMLATLERFHEYLPKFIEEIPAEVEAVCVAAGSVHMPFCKAAAGATTTASKKQIR